MKNKKLLFLLDDVWSMGKDKGVVSLYKLLKECDNNYMTIFTTEKNDLNKEFSNAEVHYFRPPFSMEGKNNRYYKLALNRLNTLSINLQYIYKFLTLKNKKYDLLYCSSSMPVYASIFIQKIFNIKGVHRMYGTFLYAKLGKYIEYFKNLEEFMFFKTKTDKYIITDDGTFGNKVAEYFNIPLSKVAFLRNGVSRYILTSSKNEIYKKYGLEENTFYILSVSRLVNWKRVDRTIQAMNKIQNVNIVYLVVGDGPEKEILESMSTKNNVKFMGAKTHTEVRELMKIIDIFVSMYDLSNVGNPLLEALVEGCAIITYDTGDTSSVIDSKNGILIPFYGEDEEKIIKALVHHIDELAYDNNKLQELKRNALLYGNKHLVDWDKRIENEIDILSEVIVSEEGDKV
jgi:glycosyltransferase involved in cell wall biosynthesis